MVQVVVPKFTEFYRVLNGVFWVWGWAAVVQHGGDQRQLVGARADVDAGPGRRLDAGRRPGAARRRRPVHQRRRAGHPAARNAPQLSLAQGPLFLFTLTKKGSLRLTLTYLD